MVDLQVSGAIVGGSPRTGRCAAIGGRGSSLEWNSGEYIRTCASELQRMDDRNLKSGWAARVFVLLVLIVTPHAAPAACHDEARAIKDIVNGLPSRPYETFNGNGE